MERNHAKKVAKPCIPTIAYLSTEHNLSVGVNTGRAGDTLEYDILLPKKEGRKDRFLGSERGRGEGRRKAHLMNATSK